jgi:ABC-type transporter MlaC component
MFRPLAIACLALFLALPAAPRAAEAEREAALEVARTLVESAHGAMTAAELSEAERNDRLRAAIAEAFAFDIWERFLLQGREDRLTQAERETFGSLLPGFMADLYADRFGQGLEAKPVIKGAEPARRDILVSGLIPRDEERNLPVQWRIRAFDERGHKVIDVMVGGVSFLVLKREEFGAILEKGGAGALLAHMRENSV